MVSRDVEIPGRGVIFSPKVLFKQDADAWNMELVISHAVQGTNLTNRRNRRLFDWCGVADLVQRVQGHSGGDKRGDGDESIQDYKGPDSGGEMLRGRVRGARSMGSGRSGSVTRGYKQASNKRVKTITRTRNSRLVNRVRGFFACVVTNGRRLT